MTLVMKKSAQIHVKQEMGAHGTLIQVFAGMMGGMVEIVQLLLG